MIIDYLRNPAWLDGDISISLYYYYTYVRSSFKLGSFWIIRLSGFVARRSVVEDGLGSFFIFSSLGSRRLSLVAGLSYLVTRAPYFGVKSCKLLVYLYLISFVRSVNWVRFAYLIVIRGSWPVYSWARWAR